MADEIEVEREVDPKTGRVTRRVTEKVGPGRGDITVTTTTYDKRGGIQMRVVEVFHRPGEDRRERSNLVERTTQEFDETGRTVIKETVETIGEGVNEVPKTKTVTEWALDPKTKKRTIKVVRIFHWKEGKGNKKGEWVQDTTITFDADEKWVSTTHP